MVNNLLLFCCDIRRNLRRIKLVKFKKIIKYLIFFKKIFLTSKCVAWTGDDDIEIVDYDKISALISSFTPLMERLARVFLHPFVNAFGQPLVIFAQERVGLVLAYIYKHRFAFLPCSGYERAERFINNVHIDEPFGNQHTH